MLLSPDLDRRQTNKGGRMIKNNENRIGCDITAQSKTILIPPLQGGGAGLAGDPGFRPLSGLHPGLFSISPWREKTTRLSRLSSLWANRIIYSVLFLALLYPTCIHAEELSNHDAASLLQTFRQPPDDARIMMRWWWFGAGVEKLELEREMVKMKSAGIGGFEIQPVYPLELDDPQVGFHNASYLSDEFLSDVRFVNEKAKELGMRVDLTLASGWPYGGPHIPVTQAAGQLRLVATPIANGATSVPLPSVGNGEALLAVFRAHGEGRHFAAATAQRLTLPASGEQRITLSAPGSDGEEILFFLSSRTGQMVKRPAVGADGFVLDHFDRSAIENHLKVVGDRLMQAFGDKPPYAVFSDSLEVFGSDWTSNFPAEFQKRRGYDILPYLPLLYSGTSEEAQAVRHDWGLTLAELIDENYLSPITAWAHRHQTRFRSQTYGIPAVTESSNSLVDLPEGEGPQWRSFSFTRWATSASHLYRRPVTSSETWTWIHSPAFRATPLDLKQEADRFFLEGINQIIGHGWPYSPPSAAEPGWAFYASGALNDHNPWFIVMPDVTRYLQRMSWLLRQGNPANDIAIFLPTDDAMADYQPGHASITERMPKFITPELTASILDAGYNFDYIDAGAVDKLGVQYPVLVLPNVDRISLSTYRKLEAYLQNGGKIIALGRLPEHAPGLKDEGDSPAVHALSQSLFSGAGKGVYIQDVQELGAALKKEMSPDMVLSNPSPAIGFLHRKLADADIYFVANTGNEPVDTQVTFRSKWKTAEEWNPFSGESSQLSPQHIGLDLAPYESTVVVFHDGAPTSKKFATEEIPSTVLADLSQDWQVHFLGTGKTETMHDLQSWTANPQTEYYSGVASYERDFDLKKVPAHALLDFGEGKPLPIVLSKKPGTHAWLDSPIREAAVVTINGQQAGFVWHPPFQLDVTPLLKAGKNHIEVRVANTGINTWSGHSLTDYRLLNMRYGERFVPQDVQAMQPIPSGILGSVQLREEQLKSSHK